MNLTKKLTPVAVAATLAMGGAVAMPSVASAEVTGNMGVANFYLWRGLDISAGAPQVSGGLDYVHDTGAYAGVWATSEEAGTETDFYVGFGGEAGPVSYDLSVWYYIYPSDNALSGPGSDLGDSDLSETILGLGIADFGLGIVFSGNGAGEDYTYTTLDYSYADFNVLYGFWSFDTTQGHDDAHIDLSYAATDNFTLTVTMGLQDTDGSVNGYDEDPLFHVSYSLPVEM